MKLVNPSGTDYRQGDVMAVRHNALPKMVQKRPSTYHLVLAEGEVTGHAHTITKEVDKLLEYELTVALDTLHLPVRTRFFTADELLDLCHQEHEAHTLEPAVYEIRQQREWSDAMEPRRVLD